MSSQDRVWRSSERPGAAECRSTMSRRRRWDEDSHRIIPSAMGFAVRPCLDDRGASSRGHGAVRARPDGNLRREFSIADRRRRRRLINVFPGLNAGLTRQKGVKRAWGAAGSITGLRDAESQREASSLPAVWPKQSQAIELAAKPISEKLREDRDLKSEHKAEHPLRA